MPETTTDQVLGSSDDFMASLKKDPVQGKLMQAAVTKYMQRDTSKLPTVGGPFREGRVVTLGGEELALSSLCKSGRPLVLNFGSCS